jgi:hypothetical protein
MLGLDSQEYRFSSRTLVTIAGKLPYCKEPPMKSIGLRDKPPYNL